MNGHQFESSLFSRLDRNLSINERIMIDTIVHQQRTQEILSELPRRIASAILEAQAAAAPKAAAVNPSAWADLVRSLTSLGTRVLIPVALLLLLAVERVTIDQIGALSLPLLK